MEGVKTRSYPTLHLLLAFSPGMDCLCPLLALVSHLFFCPAVAYPLSFPFSRPKVFVAVVFCFVVVLFCSFCSLSPGPFSSHYQLSVHPLVWTWPQVTLPCGMEEPQAGEAGSSPWGVPLGGRHGGWISRRPTAQCAECPGV